MNFYKSGNWKKKRENVLRRDEYMCRECKRYGLSTAATMVHHIFPLELYPERRIDSTNLLSLCNSCHGKMHIRETHELTDKGIEWQMRIT
jgi:5-methylcytosine-specific restriction protein A